MPPLPSPLYALLSGFLACAMPPGWQGVPGPSGQQSAPHIAQQASAVFATPGATHAQPAQSGIEAEPPRLEVQYGWARLTLEGKILLATPEEVAPPLTSRTYLELGATSRARLVWPGGAQVQLNGTTGLELDPEPDTGGLGWTWRFRRLTTAEIDIRRGAHSLYMPQGQMLMPARALFRLEGTAGGATRLFHRAGNRIELDLGGRYTFLVPVGAHRPLPLRLDPLPASYRGRTATSP